MKYVSSVVLIGFFGALGWGCSSYFDINQNPNLPPSSEPEYIFSTPQLDLAVSIGGEPFNIGGFFAQYWTQASAANQYVNLDSYNPGGNALDITYENLTSSLSNLKIVQKAAEKDKNWGVNLAVITLESYAWQMLVDLFDRMPYKEALNPTILQPKYDGGEEIYQSVIDKLKEAQTKNFEAKTSDWTLYKDADLLLSEDTDKWQSFAKSLLLKLYMRRSFTGAYNMADIEALIMDTNIPFIEEDVKFNSFEDVNTKRNPWADTRDRLGSINHVASKTLANYLVANNDPRIEAIYSVDKKGGYNANWQGDFNHFNGAEAQIKLFATPNISKTHPVYFLTVSEVNFFLAEFYAKKGDFSNAKSYYEKGINASLKTHEITDSDIATTTYSWDIWEGSTPTDFESALKKIALQKWISLAKINHIEAFFELNRTGYPQVSTINPIDDRKAPFEGGQLTLSVAGSGRLNGDFPKRFLYPKSEKNTNGNSPPQPSSIAEKIWWDQK